METLLDLPWQTLLTLACGYAGYYVAHAGIRDHHKQVDVVFRVLLFGFLSQAFYQTTLHLWPDAAALAALIAFGLTVCAGALWRRYLRALYVFVIRAAGVSYVDDFQSARHMSYDILRGHAPTQITVWLTDGSIYCCDDLSAFNDCPMAPYMMGNDGDLVMYANLEQMPGADELTDIPDVRGGKGWGVKSYYFPASEIVRIAFRNAVKPISD